MTRRIRDIAMLSLAEEAVLIVLYRLGSMGRVTLSRILDLPEGIVRGMIYRMSTARLLEITSRGVKLTEKGYEQLSNLLSRRSIEGIVIQGHGFLGLNMPSVILHIRGKAGSIGLGLEERDRAIATGAKALVAIKYVDGRLQIPGVVEDMRGGDEVYARILREHFNLIDGDLILAVFSDNVWKALIAALHVADNIPARRS
jgi:CTP-dependent riboflavin kinase